MVPSFKQVAAEVAADTGVSERVVSAVLRSAACYLRMRHHAWERAAFVRRLFSYVGIKQTRKSA